jgi:hypothetical protein
LLFYRNVGAREGFRCAPFMADDNLVGAKVPTNNFLFLKSSKLQNVGVQNHEYLRACLDKLRKTSTGTLIWLSHLESKFVHEVYITSKVNKMMFMM